jgi:phage terminase small subunit
MALLTNQQKLFCKAYIENGNNGTDAAISAGYSEKNAASQASKLTRSPKIIQYLQLLQTSVEDLFQAEVKDSIANLAEIRDDKKAPAAARVSASKDLLDRAGYGAVKKLDAKITANVTNTDRKEVHILQEIINQNDDVAEKILGAIKSRTQLPAIGTEELITAGDSENE